jgi:hypothetical protein
MIRFGRDKMFASAASINAIDDWPERGRIPTASEVYVIGRNRLYEAKANPNMFAQNPGAARWCECRLSWDYGDVGDALAPCRGIREGPIPRVTRKEKPSTLNRRPIQMQVRIFTTTFSAKISVLSTKILPVTQAGSVNRSQTGSGIINLSPGSNLRHLSKCKLRIIL